MLWSRLRDLATYPLLDHWWPAVVQLLLEHGAIHMLDRTSERLSGVWVDLSLSSVQDALGQRADHIISLIQSAKLNGYELHAYLKGVLRRLPAHKAS